MKRIYSFFFTVFLCAAVFSYDGIMAGQKNLKVIKTAYFDIIFAPDSSASAILLSENADRIYEELAVKMRLPHDFRMPVVISPGQDEYNAYFSFAPFNHIVMYDTVPMEKMAVFSETFLMTFTHELTHAVTYNMLDGFWYNCNCALGNAYNPGAVTITMAWAEGASVSFESEHGEGRLNDEYSMHLVKQAKIEGCFPKYAEIQGARDIFPAGQVSYYFGGAFNAWLQKTYGMEKYSQFWYKCVNFQALTYFGCFKAVYGIPIKQAWNDFIDSIEIPAVPADPAENSWCSNFPGSADKNGQFSCFETLTQCPSGFAFADCGKTVYFCEKRNKEKISDVEKNGYKKPRKLFSHANVERIVLSQDGLYMAVSYTSEAGKLPINRVRIYDMKRRRFFTVKETNLRDAAVIQCGKDYYLAAVKTHSQFSSIKIYKLEIGSGEKIKAAVPADEIKTDFGEQVYSLSDAGSGILSWIYKKGMEFSICGYNLKDCMLYNWAPPETRMVMRNISPCGIGDSGNIRVSFSWTKPGNMPRLGFAELSEKGALYELQDGDVSGGVYWPVMLEEGITAYTGIFYRGNRLLLADTAAMDFKSTATACMVENRAERIKTAVDVPSSYNGMRQENNADQMLSENHAELNNIDRSIKNESERIEKYNPFDYVFRGSLVPIGIIQTCAINETEDGLKGLMIMTPIGLSFVSSTPWTLPLWGASVSYNPLSLSAGFAAEIQGGTSTDLFKYIAHAQVEFDDSGYKQTYEMINLSSKIMIGNISYIFFSERFDFFEGRQSLTSIPKGKSIFDYGYLKNKDTASWIYISNSTSASIGNIHKAGAGNYEYAGCLFSIGYNLQFCSPVADADFLRKNYQNMTAGFTAAFPYLLPISCNYGLTYNLPLQFNISLFSSKLFFMKTGVSSILFSKELQWAPDVIPLFYVNRFTVKSYYNGNFYDGRLNSWSFIDTAEHFSNLVEGKVEYYDEAGLTLSLALTPGIGFIARSLFQFELSTTFKYRFNPIINENVFELEICGFTVF